MDGPPVVVRFLFFATCERVSRSLKNRKRANWATDRPASDVTGIDETLIARGGHCQRQS